MLTIDTRPAVHSGQQQMLLFLCQLLAAGILNHGSQWIMNTHTMVLMLYTSTNGI